MSVYDMAEDAICTIYRENPLHLQTMRGTTCMINKDFSVVIDILAFSEIFV